MQRVYFQTLTFSHQIWSTKQQYRFKSNTVQINRVSESMCHMQGVRMKRIQNKIIISQKASLYTFMGYTLTKGSYQSFLLSIQLSQ
jgi:predicted component of type VI protein secretion system